MPLDEAPNSTNFGGWASPCNDFWNKKCQGHGPSVEVNKNCDLKICDFGLARGLGNDEVRCGCSFPQISHPHWFCHSLPGWSHPDGLCGHQMVSCSRGSVLDGHCETSHPFIQHPTLQKINRLSSWQVVLLASEYTKSIDVWSVGFACGESERFSQIQAPKNKVVLG